MLSRLLEPAARERDRRGDPNEHSDGCQSQQTVQQLKDEVPPTRAQPSAPTPADVTLLREHAVEQHEAHHTTDVHEDESNRERGDDEDRGEGRERRQQRGIDSERTRHSAVWSTAWSDGRAKVRAVTSVRAQFSREQADESQLRPLRNAERFEQLLLRVLNCERDRVCGRYCQLAPRLRTPSASKLLRIAPAIN